MTSLVLIQICITLVVIVICCWPLIVRKKAVSTAIDSEVQRSDLNLALYKQRITQLEKDEEMDQQEKQDLISELKIGLLEDTDLAQIHLEKSGSVIQDAPASTESTPENNGIFAAIIFIGLLAMLPVYHYLYEKADLTRLLEWEKQTPALLKALIGGEKPGTDFQEKLTIMDAIMMLQRHLQKRPNDFKAWEQLSVVLLELDEYSRALVAIDKAIAADPGNAHLVLVKVQILLSESGGVFTEQTDALLIPLVSLEELNVGAYMLLGVSHLQAGDFKATLKWWTQLEQRLPAGSPMLPMVQQSLAKARIEIEGQSKQ